MTGTRVRNTTVIGCGPAGTSAALALAGAGVHEEALPRGCDLNGYVPGRLLAGDGGRTQRGPACSPAGRGS